MKRSTTAYVAVGFALAAAIYEAAAIWTGSFRTITELIEDSPRIVEVVVVVGLLLFILDHFGWLEWLPWRRRRHADIDELVATYHHRLDLVPYAMTLCYASVCTSLSDDEATTRLNAGWPTGVGPWTVSTDTHFADGVHTNPCPCDQHPDTHRHILFHC